ncbi:efflux RND transporter periplasmic adaptor subunit [Paraburkholderia franconis]|uniref:hypothetical protein n=1 Tax=Paraburkholderia franconis TaxID=2654983 RepID=UPI003898DB9A
MSQTKIDDTSEMYLDVTRSSADWLRLRKAFASGRLKRAGSGAAVQLVMEGGTPYAHAGVLQFSGITVDATTFAARLDMTIKRAKVTSSGVARSLRVPEHAVTLWRAGVTVPKRTDGERLSELLDVDVTWLCAGEG